VALRNSAGKKAMCMRAAWQTIHMEPFQSFTSPRHEFADLQPLTSIIIIPDRIQCFSFNLCMSAQAPSRSNPPDFAHRAHTRNSAADVDGRLGRESIVLKVIDYIETLRDPYDLKETTRIDIDP
jgi:hypothetical protein